MAGIEGECSRKAIELAETCLRPGLGTWLTAWNALHSPEPDPLDHYTNVSGLQGIIESQRMWASHALYLNDATELVYAGGIIEQALSDAQPTARGAVATFLERALRMVHDPLPTLDVYLVCFCTEGDLLSQWRSYGRGTGGYALQIETRRLSEYRGARRTVLYDREEQCSIVSNLVSLFCKTLVLLQSEHDEVRAVAAMPTLLGWMQNLLAECYVCFKHPAFKQEHEWRIVHVQEARPTGGTPPESLAEVKFRSQNGILIPYVELLLHAFAGTFHGRIPISAVRVGPSAHPALAAAGIRAFLHHHDYWQTAVDLSTAPLRH